MYAYIKFALIEGLDTVEVKNTSDTKRNIIITRDDATKAMGRDISEYGKSSEKFKELLREIYAYHYLGQ